MNVTASDQQRSLLRYMGAQNDPSAVIDARRAIMEALKEMWGRHDWPYYMGQQPIRLVAPYSTGTVTYEYATRQVTLTGGTWPDWAVYGALVIGTRRARVAKRISDTIIQLEDGTKFTADIATSTYSLYRAEYPLPSNIRKVSYVSLEDNSTVVLKYIPPQEFYMYSPTVSGSIPRYYTIQKDRSRNEVVMSFYPYPVSEQFVRYNFVRMPEEIEVWSETSGKISTVSTTDDVTGNGTAFEDRHEGCLIRIGRNANDVPTALHDMYPFSEEHIVNAVSGATALELFESANNTWTNVKYEISSLLDFDEDVMTSLFNLQCYYELGKHRRLQDKDQIVVARQLEIALKHAKSKSNTTAEIIYAGNNRSGRTSCTHWVVVE